VGAGPPAERAAEATARAREEVAALLGVEGRDVLFTASGSEANNLAVKGIAWSAPRERRRIVVSAVEHPSVLHSARFLEKQGFALTVVPVDGTGRIDPEVFREALGEGTALAAVTAASNEIGTVQPIAALAEACAATETPLVVDGVAAAGRLPLRSRAAGASALSVAAHAFGGPSGVGALWVREGVRLTPLLHGGVQEEGRRAGTPSVAALVAMGLAARRTAETLETRRRRLDTLTAMLRERLAALAPPPILRLTGHPEERLPGHLSYLAEGIEGESVVTALALEGILASTGYACSRADLASPVLTALGFSAREARGSLTFTLETTTTGAAIDALVGTLGPILTRLRRLSPLVE